MKHRRWWRDPFWILLLALPPLLIFPNLGASILWQDEAQTALLGRSVLVHGLPRAEDQGRLIGDQLDGSDVSEVADRQGAVLPTESTARPVLGDVNGDKRFDQRDVVQLLQRGKYLTDLPAVSSDGDWTGDGLVNQLDIVAALQQGAYANDTIQPDSDETDVVEFLFDRN